MANTTFNGTVRSESGLKVVSKNSTTGAYTDKMTFDSSGRMITTTGSHLKYTAATGYAASDFIVGKGGSSANTVDPYEESSTQLFPLLVLKRNTANYKAHT